MPSVTSGSARPRSCPGRARPGCRRRRRPGSRTGSSPRPRSGAVAAAAAPRRRTARGSSSPTSGVNSTTTTSSTPAASAARSGARAGEQRRRLVGTDHRHRVGPEGHRHQPRVGLLARAARIRAACPRCTPSKLPITTTLAGLVIGEVERWVSIGHRSPTLLRRRPPRGRRRKLLAIQGQELPRRGRTARSGRPAGPARAAGARSAPRRPPHRRRVSDREAAPHRVGEGPAGVGGSSVRI